MAGSVRGLASMVRRDNFLAGVRLTPVTQIRPQPHALLRRGASPPISAPMTSPAPAPEAGRSAAALYTLMSVMFINIMGFGIVVPLLPFYAQSFHAQPWQIALIFSAYSLGSFFGEPFWGRLSDRIGRKPILVCTTLANCACYGALAFAPNIDAAFVIRLLGGMAAGSGSVVQGYIADVTPVDERATSAWRAWARRTTSASSSARSSEACWPRARWGLIGFHIPLLAASALRRLLGAGHRPGRAGKPGAAGQRWSDQAGGWSSRRPRRPPPGDRPPDPADLRGRHRLHRHRIDLRPVGAAPLRLGPQGRRHLLRGLRRGLGVHQFLHHRPAVAPVSARRGCWPSAWPVRCSPSP